MNEDELYERIASILETARTQVARTVNTAMVHAYWRIGREIVQVEQGGATRAGYGEQLMEQLARRLTAQYGRGFGVATIRRIRAFYLAFPGGSAIREIRSTALTESASEIRSTALIESDGPLFPPILGWSHYLVLLRVQREDARRFYEIEAARESWSVRELERQIGSLLFERLSANKTADEVAALTRGYEVATARDVIKDPSSSSFSTSRAVPRRSSATSSRRSSTASSRSSSSSAKASASSRARSASPSTATTSTSTSSSTTACSAPSS